MNIKRDLIKVLFSNIIVLLSSLASGFIIPAVLGIKEFANFKTYMLLIQFAGLLHVGFIDGIYLKYGGRELDSIDMNSLNHEHRFFLIFQLILMIPFLVIGIIKRDIILILFSFSFVIVNGHTFFMFFYQAIGDFTISSIFKTFLQVYIFIANITIIFIFKLNTYLPFVIIHLSAYFFSFMSFELLFSKKFSSKGIKFNNKGIKEIFSNGIYIMLGNIIFILIFSIDRWFVKLLFPTNDFAYYSFVVSLMTIIIILISSVSIVLFPYLSKRIDNNILEIKEKIILVGTLFSGLYFVFAWVINIFLKKYIITLPLSMYLFLSIPVIGVIYSLYLNLYKIEKSRKKYLFIMVKYITISIILNTFAIFIKKDIKSIAISTTMMFYLWYYFSSFDFERIKVKFKELVFLFLYVLIFVCTVNYLSLFFGFLVYYLLIIIVSWLFFKNTVKNIFFKKQKNNIGVS